MRTTFNEELGRRLRRERRSRDLRQQDIAEILNVSTDAISAWEAGTSSIKAENLVGYLKALAKHDDGSGKLLSIDEITGFAPAEINALEYIERTSDELGRLRGHSRQ